MQQPRVTVYADVAEVRMEVQGAECNRLLADGWVLLGIYPLTTVGEMTEGGASEDREWKQPQGTQVCATFRGLCCGKETKEE
jgi:hypothetical protein